MPQHSARAPSQRQLRLGELIRHELSAILLRSDEIRDEDLAGQVVTVCEVRISPDAKAATVYVVPMLGPANAPDRQKAFIKALNRNAKYLRGELGKRLEVKFTPALRFELDGSFDEAERIEGVLRAPQVARDLG
ncbi:MAG: 30S ribosome-binding factor RbfA [Pseudomonadota bacterium]